MPDPLGRTAALRRRPPAAAAPAACSLLLPQEFLSVFERLRDEIVNDEMLAGQPESSKKWVKEVRQEGESQAWQPLPRRIGHGAGGCAAVPIDQH